MRAYERFLRYIHVDTASDRTSKACPSTAKQVEFAKVLVQEMKDMGISDARWTNTGYVYGSIPATVENQPSIGLVAHMDVIEDVPCAPMNERMIENYDGGVITLANGMTTDPKDFPDLKKHVGKTLIVTDGNTILGGDDKAGVAEILTMAEELIADPSFPHGKICIGFTPDEEVGRGTEDFNVAEFGADFAYTADGGALGGIEFENFNAADGNIKVNGVNTHPGGAKNKMKNAMLIAMEFNSLLPASSTPAHTEGYEGFYHLNRMNGREEEAELKYIIRDHDKAKFEGRKAFFADVAAFLNRKHGEGTVECEIIDSYSNMREVLEPHMDVVHRAEDAYRALGIEPFNIAIRGGTDGARLSYMGLPCPNIATGGMNAHGRREMIAIEDMDTMVKVMKEIIRAR